MLKDMIKITMTKNEYSKTASGKNWSTVADTSEIEEITLKQYENIINSCDFFKNLGGSERLSYTYFCIGYKPYRLTSINPDRTKKVVRLFKIEMKNEK